MPDTEDTAKILWKQIAHLHAARLCFFHINILCSTKCFRYLFSLFFSFLYIFLQFLHYSQVDTVYSPMTSSSSNSLFSLTSETTSASMAPTPDNMALNKDALSMGAVPYPVPKFDNPAEQRVWMLEHMAGALRVFSRKGYTEGTAGHISIRDPVDPETFWINPLAKHFGLIRKSDMVHVGKDGEILNNTNGRMRSVNMAGFKIHSTLHRARPDIWAACHTHSIYGKAYSSFGRPLDMISQDACTFYNIHTVYDNFGGVVLNEEEGNHIAQALGENNRAIILKNHGLLTVGSTVDEAAYLFTLMERTCQAQLLVDAAAEGSGNKPSVISHEAAEYTFINTAHPDMLYGEFQPDYEYEMAMDASFLT